MALDEIDVAGAADGDRAREFAADQAKLRARRISSSEFLSPDLNISRRNRVSVPSPPPLSLNVARAEGR